MSRIFARMAAVGVALVGTVGAAHVCPSTAAAQIASVVRPPSSRNARPATPLDTSTAQVNHPTTQLTGLTAWVDSAVLANARVSDSARADTAAAPHAGPGTLAPKHAASVGPSAGPASTVRFQNGARAPDTASLVPAIAVGGLLIFGVGVVLGRPLRMIGLALVGVAVVSYGIGLWVQHGARQAWVAAQDATRVERRAESDAMLATAASSAVSNKIAIGSAVARLVIPAVGEDDIVLEGVDPYELNGGPGHLPGSPLPGDAGNAIISAHRDRHFRHLDRLQVGDTVVTYVNGEESIWRVVGRRVVSAATPALFATEAATLTLTTCWPVRALGPAPDRLIVSATRIGTRRSAA
jgi:sortase A